MANKISVFFKKIIFSFVMLYGYNMLVPGLAIIPINVITLLIVFFLELPGMVCLIILRLLIY